MILVLSSKQSYAAKRLAQEGRGLVKIMEVRELAERDFDIDVSGFTCLYVRDPYLKGDPKYLPQIIELAKKFKAAGKKVVDANIAEGNLGLGKSADYSLLQKAGLLIPPSANEFPLVAKWIYGLGGKHVFVVKDERQLEQLEQKYPAGELLKQKLIDAEYEYKVVTVGYKSLPKVLRFKISEHGFKINFNHHQVLKCEEVPELIAAAEKAAKVLGRELAKVDILEKDGLFSILEVNRFPGLSSFERLTGQNAVKSFIDYLKS